MIGFVTKSEPTNGERIMASPTSDTTTAPADRVTKDESEWKREKSSFHGELPDRDPLNAARCGNGSPFRKRLIRQDSTMAG